MLLYLRLKANPADEMLLQLSVIQKPRLTNLSAKPKPGAAMNLKGERIRGIDWKIKHEFQKDGRPNGFVRGWHEHRWTEVDGDRFVVDVNDAVGQEDFRSLLKLCLDRWDVEVEESNQLNLRM